jgi:hypothetical protein
MVRPNETEQYSDGVIVTAAILRGAVKVLSLCVTLYVALWFGTVVGEVWREKAAQWCLDDVVACNKRAGYMK